MIVDDKREIFGIYGEDDSCEYSRDWVDKIEAYLEVDGKIWFAVFVENKLRYRINSRYIEIIRYERP